tara:strand:+ start:9292 stop:10161 length:870 start_codon:yes stop_codon:yes gene_type:complete
MKTTANLPNLNYLNKKIIWITGIERSGTTVLGNLIGSLRGTEYIYEPDTLYPILFLKNKISPDKWKMLFECYFYNDLLRNRINNRQINLNKDDDSFYLNFKENLKIKKNHFDIFKKNKIVPRSKIIIKIPGLIKEVIELKKYFNNFKFIIIERNGLEILSSIIKKNWFKKDHDNRHFPYIKYKEKCYPFWLKKKYFKSWKKFSSSDKAAFYVIQLKKIINKNKKIYKINYDQLVSNPIEIINDISRKFNLLKTPKTVSLLKKIKKRKNKKIDLRKKIRKDLFDQLVRLN